MDISDIEYVESALKTSLREGDRIIIEDNSYKKLNVVAVVKKVLKKTKANIRVGISWSTVTTKFVILDIISDNKIVVATCANNSKASWANQIYTKSELISSDNFPAETIEVLEIVPCDPIEVYKPSILPNWPERVLPKTVPYDGVRPLPLEPFLTYSKNGEKNYSTASD